MGPEESHSNLMNSRDTVSLRKTTYLAMILLSILLYLSFTKYIIHLFWYLFHLSFLSAYILRYLSTPSRPWQRWMGEGEGVPLSDREDLTTWFRIFNSKYQVHLFPILIFLMWLVFRLDTCSTDIPGYQYSDLILALQTFRATSIQTGYLLYGHSRLPVFRLDTCSTGILGYQY